MAAGAAGDVLHFFSASSCKPCELQRAVLEEFAEAGDIPEDMELQEHCRTDAETAGIFSRYNITRWPVLVITDDDGNEKKRHEGFCPPEEMTEFLSSAPAAVRRVLIRGRIEKVSVSTSCRTSRYSDWNCTVLLQPVAAESDPVILVVPCRRGEEYPVLPAAGDLVEVEIIPWDNAPEDIRSMALADDTGDYFSRWYYAPVISNISACGQ